MEESKAIAKRLYTEPDSRYSNVMLHILHYPYKLLYIDKDDMNICGEWDYEGFENFMKESLNRNELSIILYQSGMLSKLTYTTEQMIRMLFTHVRKEKDNIFKEFNSYFKCKNN